MAITISNKVSRRPEKRRAGSLTMPLLFAKRWLGIIHGFGRRIKSGERMFFLSQLSLMLEIGMPLNNALSAIGQPGDRDHTPGH